MNPVAGSTSTDQWVVYTPNPGASGADSFTYKGVSPGSGSGPSDEVGPERTVNLRIGAGTAPACANLSQSVPQNTATNLRLVCASGGDPIVSYSIRTAPDHGTLTTTNLNSGLVGYTSNATLLRGGLLRLPRDEHVRRRELPVAPRRPST